MSFLNKLNKKMTPYPQFFDYPTSGKSEIKETITEEDLKIMREESLEEGELICSKCKGVGFADKIESGDTSVYKNVCPKCQGTGKLDWIENVLGKKPQFYGSSSSTSGPSMSSNSLPAAWTVDLTVDGTSGISSKIIKQAADHLAKKIDDEMLEILRLGG